MNLIDKINAKQIKPNTPEFRVGDIVRVDLWIKEGKKERIQAFEGIVTSIQGGSVSKRFTVRKKSGSVVVKRTFAVNSPLIDKITVVKLQQNQSFLEEATNRIKPNSTLGIIGEKTSVYRYECLKTILEDKNVKIKVLDKDPFMKIQEKEAKMDIKEVLKHLNDDYRNVINYYYIQEKKVSEISRILKVPEGTIKSRLSRARRMMADMLKYNIEEV